jgi:hypothetical protein
MRSSENIIFPDPNCRTALADPASAFLNPKEVRIQQKCRPAPDPQSHPAVAKGEALPVGIAAIS